MTKKQKMLAAIAAMGSASAFAEGSTYTVPSSVTDAVTQMEGAADAYAGVILPYIAYIGLAFIGIAVVYLLFKVFRKFVGGGR